MLKKPGLEELVRELERDYARWEQVYMAGSKDPFWPDGVNANLCRNHILCGKRRIRELYPDAEMPEIYYRPLPQDLPAEYMARKEELRSAALRSYTRYISDENFCFIRNHVERIPETDALRGILDALLARADVLKDAVLSGDYVAMRRYADAGSLLASLKCALPGFVDSKNEEKTERNAGYLVVSHSGGGMLRQGTRKGIRRTPANRGMRAHWVVKGLDISEDVCHGMCP